MYCTVGEKLKKNLTILPKVHKLKMENLCTVGENLSVKIKTTYFYYFEMYLCRTFYKESTIIDRNVQKEC